MFSNQIFFCNKCGTALAFGARCHQPHCFYNQPIPVPGLFKRQGRSRNIEEIRSGTQHVIRESLPRTPLNTSPLSGAQAGYPSLPVQLYQSFAIRNRGESQSAPPLGGISKVAPVKPIVSLHFSPERDCRNKFIPCTSCSQDTLDYPGKCYRCGSSLCAPCCFYFIENNENSICALCSQY